MIMSNLKDRIKNMEKSYRFLLSILLLVFGIVVDIFLNSAVHDFNFKFFLYYLYFVLPGIILGITSFIKLPKLISILSTITLWLLIIGSIFIYIISAMDIYLQPVRDTKNYSYVLKELKEFDVSLKGYFPEVIPQNALQSEMIYSRPFLQGGLIFSLKLKFNEENFNSEVGKIENKYNISSSEDNIFTYQVFDNEKGSISRESLDIIVNREKKRLSIVMIMDIESRL